MFEREDVREADEHGRRVSLDEGVHVMNESKSPGVASRLVWFGLLGGPTAWLLEIALVFYTSRNCSSRTVLLIAGSAVFAALAIAAGGVSWRLSSRAEALYEESVSGFERATFYATGGVYLSGLSLLVVLMVLMTALILGGSCG
jgi:hypothetical protein